MREIKFRAWHNILEKMVETDELSKFHINAFKFNGDEEGCIFMQYTGHKDKNGKEIYEGDLVSIFDEICPIEWIQEDAFFGAVRPDGSWWGLDYDARIRMIVIGNRFENPELLGGDVDA